MDKAVSSACSMRERKWSCLHNFLDCRAVRVFVVTLSEVVERMSKSTLANQLKRSASHPRKHINLYLQPLGDACYDESPRRWRTSFGPGCTCFKIDASNCTTVQCQVSENIREFSDDFFSYGAGSTDLVSNPIEDWHCVSERITTDMKNSSNNTRRWESRTHLTHVCDWEHRVQKFPLLPVVIT